MVNLKKTCFILSVLGIFLLLILMESLKIPIKEIKDINPSLSGKTIILEGFIKEIKNYSDILVITLKDPTGEIDIISEKMNLTKGINIHVKGKVQEYESQMQISAEEIYLCEI